MEKEYLNLLDRVMKFGASTSDRTGTGTYQIFGAMLKHCLADGFPLLTTKEVHFRSLVHELIWFLKGDTSIDYLKENKVRIWDEWVKPDGTIGPGYGKQWRAWESTKLIEQHELGKPRIKGEVPLKIDQVRQLIDRLKKNPFDRRAIVNAWNVADIEEMALPPCHVMWQVNLEEAHPAGVDAYMKFQKKVVSKNLGWDYAKDQYEKRTAKYKLNLMITQRSCDMFLGVPFNIASYALLMVILCNELDAVPGDLIWSGACVHIYKNHVEQVNEQLSRRKYAKELPVVHVDKNATVDNIKFEDIHLFHYNHLPAIKAPVSV